MKVRKVRAESESRFFESTRTWLVRKDKHLKKWQVTEDKWNQITNFGDGGKKLCISCLSFSVYLEDNKRLRVGKEGKWIVA